MRVGVIQSSYVPWRGYFDFIQSVDRFVIYDDVQFSPGSWRNRNRVKTEKGLKWLTVPVKKHLGLAVDETLIEHAHPWVEQNRGLLKSSLGKSPFFRDAVELWEQAVGEPSKTIAELNVRLIREICAYLNIGTPLVFAREFQLTGNKTDRLIQLLRRIGATTYVSGPTAKGYLDETAFRENGIRLEYKSYVYEPYPQPFGPFEGAVSVLDLIANVGPRSRDFLHSREANEVAVQ
jgi:hypothetical protein